jgi:hypothetical protein
MWMKSFSTPANSASCPTESFRSVPQGLERKDPHTLTIREVARMLDLFGLTHDAFDDLVGTIAQFLERRFQKR